MGNLYQIKNLLSPGYRWIIAWDFYEKWLVESKYSENIVCFWIITVKEEFVTNPLVKELYYGK